MINQILSLLDIQNPTQEMTTKLNYIIENTKQRLMLRLGTDDVPTELEYIVVEVSIVRFNRLGSERLTSHNVEGETMSWSNEDDFKPYLSEIQGWLDAQMDKPNYIGRLSFI